MSSTIAVTGLSVSGGFVGSGLPGGILAAPALPPLMVRKRGLFGFAAAALLVALADLSARGIFPVPVIFQANPPPAYNVPRDRDTIRGQAFHLLVHAGNGRHASFFRLSQVRHPMMCCSRRA